MWIQEGYWWDIFLNPNGEYWCFHKHQQAQHHSNTDSTIGIEFSRTLNIVMGEPMSYFKGQYIVDVELSNETWMFKSVKERNEAWDQIKASPIGYYIARMI